jgi:hypothetical protein
MVLQISYVAHTQRISKLWLVRVRYKEYGIISCRGAVICVVPSEHIHVNS